MRTYPPLMLLPTLPRMMTRPQTRCQVGPHRPSRPQYSGGLLIVTGASCCSFMLYTSIVTFPELKTNSAIAMRSQLLPLLQRSCGSGQQTLSNAVTDLQVQFRLLAPSSCRTLSAQAESAEAAEQVGSSAVTPRSVVDQRSIMLGCTVIKHKQLCATLHGGAFEYQRLLHPLCPDHNRHTCCL